MITECPIYVKLYINNFLYDVLCSGSSVTVYENCDKKPMTSNAVVRFCYMCVTRTYERVIAMDFVRQLISPITPKANATTTVRPPPSPR